MANLQLFNFEEFQIRIVGTPERPEWIANDVAEVLAIPRSTLYSRLQKMPDRWKSNYSVETPGGLQKMTTVTEPGLYALIFRSDKPEVRQFQQWVFEEVLPSIRETGQYKLRPEVAKTLRMDASAVIRSMDAVIDERDQLKRENWKLQGDLHYAEKCMDAHGINYHEKDWW